MHVDIAALSHFKGPRWTHVGGYPRGCVIFNVVTTTFVDLKVYKITFLPCLFGITLLLVSEVITCKTTLYYTYTELILINNVVDHVMDGCRRGRPR